MASKYSTSKPESSWPGITSNVQFDIGPGGEDRYAFVLLGTTVKPDGSEERFEKSVVMQGGWSGGLQQYGFSKPQISGVVFNGRQVIVLGTEEEDSWIHATKVIDQQTQSVTELVLDMPKSNRRKNEPHFLKPRLSWTEQWEGTTSNVQRLPGELPDSLDSYRPLQSGKNLKRNERLAFILLGTRKTRDGSEERFEKSVQMKGHSQLLGGGTISGEIFNGRQVIVYGEEGKDGWIYAVKVVDKATGAATQ